MGRSIDSLSIIQRLEADAKGSSSDVEDFICPCPMGSSGLLGRHLPSGEAGWEGTSCPQMSIGQGVQGGWGD